MNTVPPQKQKHFLENVVALILFLLFLAAAFYTLSVFLGIFTFAVIFAVPFATLFEKLVKKLGGNRKLAAFLYGLVMVTFVALPLLYVISALTNYGHQLQVLAGEIRNHQVPALPAWITNIPYAGAKIQDFWTALESDPEGTLTTYSPQLKEWIPKLLHAGGSFISTALELILGIIISAIMLFHGNKLLEPLQTFFAKILGPNTGSSLVSATGKAINGVAVGVMGTALLATLISWIGFTIAGIPIAGGLAALVFLFTVIQVGPLLVMLPVTIWMFSQGHTGWGIFLAVWTLLLIVIDNVVKPILIGKSGKLPILVLFLGVVGGMAAWGFTGMFKGAIVLAIAYTVFTNWSKEENAIS
jgi:predicted PurR-regulated permease PerM